MPSRLSGWGSEMQKARGPPKGDAPSRLAGWRARSAVHGSGTSGAAWLLDLDRRALFLELGLHLRGLGLADLLLDRLGRAVDEVLRLLEAETRDLAHHLDDLDL